MSKHVTNRTTPAPGNHVAAAIRAGLMNNGWTQEELARRAKISRTTLHHLLQGETASPHMATITKIASAMGVSPESLCPDFVVRSAERTLPAAGKSHRSIEQQKQTFDTATNTYISEVYCDNPQLFSEWSFEDWTELYSTFGEGGALSPEGVIAAAVLQNKKRDVIRKLQVVLETDYRDVATNLIDTLFEMVQPTSSLVTHTHLQTLLNIPHGQSAETSPEMPISDDEI